MRAIVYRKDGYNYLYLYNLRDKSKLLRHLIAQARDPLLNLDWTDISIIREMMQKSTVNNN